MTTAGTVGADDRVRLFCALQLPDDVLDRLVAWQRRLPAGLFRVVGRANLHVTLAFLGSRPAGDVDAVAAALGEAGGAADAIELEVRRYWETRSVGMLVLGDRGGAAGRLAADLHARLERLGMYERERRPWLPHLTVVRFRKPPRLAPELPRLGPVAPSGAAVYLSRLRRTGAEYEVLHRVALRR